MKKVLSFCVLSVLLAVLSLGLKAQSGLVLTPANLPDPIVLNQYDTVYISPVSDCFDSLGLNPNDKVSIEWQVLYNGNAIPNDMLSYYFEEFKFESRYDLGGAERWWGNSYTSHYCQNGNGYGSYPGANTPTEHLELGQQCEDPGHFIVSLPGQNNPYQFDYFYVNWFSDVANTGHRLVYNIKVDGDYEFIFTLAKRCGGTKWDAIYENNDERYYVGGHQSEVCEILSSDSLHGIEVSNIRDYYRCVGDSLVLGNPPVTFTTPTDTTIDPGYDSVFYMAASSCYGAIDSIIRFRVFFEDPSIPVLDTANSILVLCDTGQVSISVTTTAADKCIWLDASDVVLDTLDATAAFTQGVNASTHFSVYGYNSESGCVSSDKLTVYVEVYASPTPLVSVTPNDTLCENGSFQVILNDGYDGWTWFHDGVDMNLNDTVYDVADAAMTDGGWYLATVSENHLHSVYSTVDTIACSASDSVLITVFERPSVEWASIDGNIVADSITFCPNDLDHVIVATISGGKTPYDNVTWTGVAGTETYSTGKVSDTLTFTLANTCGTVYTSGINYAIDSNGCTLKDSVEVTFIVNDTVAPTITVTGDTISAPNYGNCAYIVPDIAALITTDDNCGIADTVQVPAAGDLVTTDTIVIVTITDLCGNTAVDTIQLRLPVAQLAVDTIVVTQPVLCAGDANGIFQVTVTGGTAPYDVNIVSAEVPDSVYNQHGTATQTLFTFEGLISGKWDITITDTNGCQITDTVNVASPDVLTLTSSDWTDLTCFESNDGSFKFNVSQGVLPYNITIVRTLGTVVDSVEMILNPSVLDTNVTMTDQKAGVYVITVVDGNNCTYSVTDTLTQPDQLSLAGVTVLNHVKCYGDSTGNLAVTGVTGGTTPYTYAWVNAVNDTVSTDSVTGRILPAGVYTIYISDANNCSPDTVLTDTVKQPERALNVVSINAPISDTCPRLHTYTFDATVEGGRPNYEFEWTFNNVVAQTTPNVAAVVDTFDYIEATISCDTTFEVIFKVTDDSACVAMDTISFTIADTLAPTITGVLDTAYIDACDAAGAGDTLNTIAKLQAAGLVIDDNCTAVDALTVNFSEVVSGTCPIEVVRTYEVIDSCGNTGSIKHVIYVQDTTRPTFTRPADTTLYLDNTCSVDTTAATIGTPTNLNDNCTDATALTVSHRDVVVTGCGSTYTISRYWRVADACGNVSSSDSLQTITVSDTTPPVFTTLPMNAVAYCDGTGNAYDVQDYEDTLAGAVATDNCAFDSIAMVRDSVVEGCNAATQTYYYTISAVDVCGNTTSVQVTLSIVDTAAPYFTRHAPDMEIECDADNLQTILDQWRDTVRYEDYCSDNVTMTDSLSPFINDSICGGYYTRFWTLDDGCNTFIESHRLTIVDNIGPYFPHEYLPDASPVVECDGAGNHEQLFEWLNSVRAIDACTGPIETLNLYYYDGTNYVQFDTTAAGLLPDGIHFRGWTEIDGPCNGYYYIFWEAIDSCGNGGITSLNPSITMEHFYIKDEEGPVFPVVRTDTTVHCDFDPAELTAWLTIADAFDECSQTTYSVTDTFVFNPSCGSTGVYDVTWKSTDNCGNTTTHTATWTIIDTVAPMVTTVNTGNLMTADTLYFYDDADDLNDFLHPTYVSVTNMDTAQSATFIADFIADNTAGVTDISDCGYLKDYWYRNLRRDDPASDECHAYWQIDHIFRDACNNQVTITQDIIVLDTTAPRVNDIADDMYFYGPADGCAKEPVDTFRTIGDLNDYVPNKSLTANAQDLHLSTTNPNYIRLVNVVTNDDPSSLCDSIEVRTYEIYDSCGNFREFTHTIYYHDTIAPVLNITEVVDSIHQKGFGSCDQYSEIADAHLNDSLVNVDWLASHYGLTIDECHDFGIYLRSETESTNGAYCPGKVFVRNYQVVDSCGNASYFTVNLIVKDTVAPVAVVTELHADTVYSDNNCDFTLTDVVFTDYAQLKAWNNDADVYNDCNLGQTNNVTVYGPFISGSGCDSVFTYKYTVEDSCLNMSRDTVSITIHVLDTLAPNVTVAQATVADTMYYEDDCSIPVLDYWTNGQDALNHGVEMSDCNPAWDDNSKLVRLNETFERDVCTTVYTVRYQVKDACSDHVSDTIYQTILILDTVAPVVSDTVVDTLIYMVDDNADCWGPAVAYFSTVGDVKAYDNNFSVVDCNVGDNSEVRLVNEDSSAVQCVRTVVRTYVVVDSCGLVSNEFTQTINVSDTVAPAITATLEPQQVYMNADCDFTYTTYATISALPTDMQDGINDCNLKDELIIDSIDTLEIGGTDCNKAFTVYVNYKAQDSCGNLAAFVDTIYVADTIAPAIVGNLDTLTIYLTEGCSYTVPTAYTNVDDLPAGITITDCKLVKDLTVSEVDTLHGYCPMLIHRTYTVSDSCGHTSTFGEFFNVTDTIAPNITDNTADTVILYIAQDSSYTVPAAYTTVTELLTNGAALTDCNLVDVIDSVQTDTTLNSAVCDGSFVLRQYFAVDSCDNVSAPVYEYIKLVDTVAPWLDVTLPAYDAERTATACEFLVPNLHDTIAAHYVDNWSAFTDYNQIPAAGYAITNFRDTVVMVAFGDVCGNMDTVYVNINVPDTLQVVNISMTEPNCYGESNGTIAVEISGGAADYIYSYGVVDANDTIIAVTDTCQNIPAAFYTVTVTDMNGCVATDTITVTQPTDINITPNVSDYEICDNHEEEVTLSITGGSPDYQLMAFLMDPTYAFLDTIFYDEDITTYTGNTLLDSGSFYIAFYGYDSHNCFKADTSALITVHPTYYFEQVEDICFKDLASGYDWYDASGNHRKLVPSTAFAVSDTTYILSDSLHTDLYGCDSVYVMRLYVFNDAYLQIRRLTETSDWNMVLPYQDGLRDTFNTASTNVGWEIFVNNCTSCKPEMAVSIEYELYRLNEATDSYELMGNVTDYFQPQYRTFFDNFQLPYTPNNSSYVSIPNIYLPHGAGHDWNYDYWNLCWLAPDYNETALDNMTNDYHHTGSGDWYSDARANTILITGFGSPLETGEGDYKIVATLYKRSGTLNPSMNYTWNLALNHPVGGNSSTLDVELSHVVIYFHVDDATSPVIHMPTSDPIGGDVVFSTNDAAPTANVFPNPARDFVQVELSGFEGQTSVILSSPNGMQLQTINLDIADTNDTPIVKIQTGDYAQGVYMITARSKETIITKRVVIIK